MPRKKTVPSLTHHKAKNLASVRLDGRYIYLGKWGTPEAEAEYRRVIAEWLASGVVPTGPRRARDRQGITVGRLARLYKRYVLKSRSAEVYQSTVRPALV